MIALGNYLVRSRLNGIWPTLLLALLPLLGLPTFWLAMLLLAFITLRRGAAEGGLLLLALLLPLALFFSRVPLLMALPYALGALISWLLASILHKTHNWSLLLKASLLSAVMAVVVIYLINPDVAAWWQQMLSHFMQQMQSRLSQPATAEDWQMLQQLINRFAALFTGIAVGYYLLHALVVLLVARWWQALVFNPGGFSKEWLALRLDRWAALSLLIVTTIALLSRQHFVINLCIAMLFPFALAGTSLVHARIKRQFNERAIFFLFFFYGLLLLTLKYSLVLLALLAVVDGFYRLRRQ